MYLSVSTWHGGESASLTCILLWPAGHADVSIYTKGGKF